MESMNLLEDKMKDLRVNTCWDNQTHKRDHLTTLQQCQFTEWTHNFSCIPYTQLDPQCRKIHDSGAMDLAPSSTLGPLEMYVSFDWEYSPRAMIMGPIEYKDYDSIHILILLTQEWPHLPVPLQAVICNFIVRYTYIWNLWIYKTDSITSRSVFVTFQTFQFNTTFTYPWVSDTFGSLIVLLLYQLIIYMVNLQLNRIHFVSDIFISSLVKSCERQKDINPESLPHPKRTDTLNVSLYAPAI